MNCSNLVDVGLPVTMTYETIKVGQQNGTVFLAIFPDIYSTGDDNLNHAHAVLKQYKLTGAVDDEALQARLADPDGIARPILGSPTPVALNGAAWKGPIGPTERDGSYYLPLASLAGAAGATVNWDPRHKCAGAVCHGATARFPVDGHNAFNAMDTVFVPVRRFVAIFGGTVTYAGGKLNIALPK